ncbi:odorant receptor 4 isoform X2 [Tribolium castaneum]|uniref:odorant receptor 4 isoform X2 n=1 Tax=Tribolium castaneum TaxID=7070 RepID=UPI00077DE6F8|nr:PREDICTED: odorant receptor 4 isoform X2 [Tribolium castaneum]|eukprot:XP_015840820.1 PREDICTED: odorant receptor 4 isoform X2 [Tribolium castaneum]
MSQIDLKEAFKQNIVLLKAMGLWFFQNERFYKLFKCFVQGSLVFDSTSLIIYVALNIRIKNVTDTIYSLPGSLEVVLQAILFRKNFHLIRKSLNNLKQKEFQPKNDTQEKILKDSIALSRRVFYSFFWLVFVMIGMWMVLPLTKKGKYLPTKYWIPFDYRLPVVYELLYVFECSCIIFHAFSNVALDTFFSIAMIQIGAQCDVLCDTIRNMDEQEKTNTMDRILIECVHHYRLIEDFAKSIATSFKEILMVQFVCSSLMLCVSMYELSLISATNEIFLYCWFGNEVIIKSERLFYAMFESKWYDSAATHRKNLMIFAHQVQKPISLLVWNIFPVDLKTFGGLLQKCWSFFVAMKNIQEIQE